MFSERLSSLREKKGLSQEEISKRLRMARTTYQGYENGKREPDINTLIKIADFHEVSLDYLLGRTNDPKVKYSESTSTYIESLDFTDNKLLGLYNLTFEGSPLSQEEAKEFLAIARAIFSTRRASK